MLDEMGDGMIVGFILGIPAFFLGFVLVIIGAIAVPAWILKWIIG